MALSGQVQTYLERTVDGTLWLPSDAQRLLTQLRDLDGRAEELRAICERKADELLEQPTGNGRGSTMEHSDAIASERSLLERDQRELLFCQAEKVEVRCLPCCPPPIRTCAGAVVGILQCLAWRGEQAGAESTWRMCQVVESHPVTTRTGRCSVRMFPGASYATSWSDPPHRSARQWRSLQEIRKT